MINIVDISFYGSYGNEDYFGPLRYLSLIDRTDFRLSSRQPLPSLLLTRGWSNFWT